MKHVNKQADLARGKAWEHVPKAWQQDNGFTIKKYDAQADIKYHVDFVAIKQEGELTRSITADVKADNKIYKTNNVAQELFNDTPTNKKGWGQDENVHAEYIIVVDTAFPYRIKPFYIFPLSALREYYKSNKASQKHHTYMEQDENGYTKTPTIALLSQARQADDIGYWYVYPSFNDSYRYCFKGRQDVKWKIGKLIQPE